MVAMHWEALDHQPYSPDLSLCDVYMFGHLKKALGGKRFKTKWKYDQVEIFMSNWLNTRLASFYEKVIKKPSKHWESVT